MVSIMSSISRCTSPDRMSRTGTGAAACRRMGCPSRATFRIAMSTSPFRERILPQRSSRSPPRDASRSSRVAARPLRPVAVRLVGLEVAEERVEVGGRVPEVEVLLLDEALVDAALDLRPQRIEVAVEVEQGDRLRVVAELLEGHHLQHLLEGAEAAGQSHEGVAALVHDGLAVAQPVGDD